jgi:anthranilate phosphoribosyltransferase
MFHPAMKFAAGPRSEIGIRSVFNILGPLTNPAYAEYQVIGVPSIDLAEKIVPALMRLSVKHALVVHGLNGMDEISITGRSMCWEIRRGELQRYRQQIAPEDFGLQRASENAVRGGTPEENAQTVLKVLRGSRGPIRDVVLLNAAAALLAGDRVETMQQGVELARETLDTGRALEKLTHLIELTQSFARGEK